MSSLVHNAMMPSFMSFHVRNKPQSRASQDLGVADMPSLDTALRDSDSPLCFFAGTLHSDSASERGRMVEAMRHHHLPCRVHLVTKAPGAEGLPNTTLWSSGSEALDKQTYMRTLRSSALALAPAGNNPETFRHWEAFALGVVPVSVRPAADRSYLDQWCTEGAATHDAFSKRWASHTNGNWCPLLLLESWEELPALIRTLDSTSAVGNHRRGLSGFRSRVARWHGYYLAQLAGGISELLMPAL